MANVKVTDLAELSVEQIGKFTWFLASHETDEHDERTSNKISYPTISTHMSSDLSIYDLQCAVQEASGGQSARIVKLRKDLDQLSADSQLYITRTDTINELAKKQDVLSSGMNIKNISINGGPASSILGEGTLNLVASGGSGGGPTAYLKSATKSADGNSLYIYDQSNKMIEFSPTAGSSSGSAPADYNAVKSRITALEQQSNTITANVNLLQNSVSQLQNIAVSIERHSLSSGFVSVPAQSFYVYKVDNALLYDAATLKMRSVIDTSYKETADVTILGTYFIEGGFSCTLYNNTASDKKVGVKYMMICLQQTNIE